MSFGAVLALLVGLFVAAPIAAHLLRRRRAAERIFPGAVLLGATPPTARRRSALEDRALFGVRALAVLLLALLGAMPFVSCSRLALTRKDGASTALAIVLDDSLSMRAAPEADAPTRFERARQAALELVDASRPGDAIAVVLAGDPPRVALAASTDREAARATLAAAAPSDRATDLEGALSLGRDLLRGLPHKDKRVVVLSDLADGRADGAPLDVEGDVALWAPLPDLAATSQADCAIASVVRRGERAEITFACSPGTTADGRRVAIRRGEVVLVEEALTPGSMAHTLRLAADAGPTNTLIASLSAGDAIASDDVAPLIDAGDEPSIAVLADAASVRLETGGRPPVEQALAALELGERVRTLPVIPDHAEELTAVAGVVLDDPPGLTPEQRRALATWLERGGTLLLGLGRRAAAAPLGAGFEGVLPGVVRWGPSPARGAETKKCAFLGPSAPGLADLAPEGRALLEHAAVDGADVLCPFDDGAPLLLRRHVGRGTLFVVALPFGAHESDLPLRPAFLALLERFAEAARAGGGARRVDAGQSFAFPGQSGVSAKFEPLAGGPLEPVVTEQRDGVTRVPAARAGRYWITLEAGDELRVATVPPRELDLRPRALSPRAADPSLGGETERVDASPWFALALLALLVLESVLRLAFGRPEAQTVDVRTSLAPPPA